MITVLYVSLGAALGATMRYGCQQLLGGILGLPLGIITANLVGCFLIGYFYSVGSAISEELRMGLMTGFIGSLTTMSGFALNFVTLSANKQYLHLVSLFALTFIGGLAMCIWGMSLGK